MVSIRLNSFSSQAYSFHIAHLRQRNAMVKINASYFHLGDFITRQFFPLQCGIATIIFFRSHLLFPQTITTCRLVFFFIQLYLYSIHSFHTRRKTILFSFVNHQLQIVAKIVAETGRCFYSRQVQRPYISLILCSSNNH